MVDVYKLLDKQRYFRIRYELDQILPDATIQVTKGKFTSTPYTRVSFRIEFFAQRDDIDPPYGFSDL